MRTRAARSRDEAADELLMGPMRGELLGAEHLAARARAIARGQRVVVERGPLRPARLLERLAQTKAILASARSRLAAATAAGVEEEPAASWLLDNYHIVQEHLQEVRTALPGGFYRELPELANGPLAGYPRVYALAIALIAHTESRIDVENVDLFVDAFQTVTTLSIGELWAIPAMLRLGLIESVRRMSLRALQRLDEIESAEHWAHHLVTAHHRGGRELRAALRLFADFEHALTPHYICRCLQALRDAEGASQTLAWVENWMRDRGANPETALAESTHRLTMTRIMMANSILSLRDIGQRDWPRFVEQHSAMDGVLREDPSGFYGQMTFATRDRYRHVVERIARRTGHRETSVARWAVDLARPSEGAPPPADPRVTHVGYYLIDDGLHQLERRAGYVPNLGERVERAIRRHPDLVFDASLAVTTVIALLAAMFLVGPSGRTAFWLVLLVTFLPALDIAVNTVNQLLTAWLPPNLLPELDFSEHGVPDGYHTIVVVPTLFASRDDVREALANLEVQFLSCREDSLRFAILGDFTDAPEETLPGDADIVAEALAGIQALNARHASPQAPLFHLLHRPRRWNPQQGVWMGWERKRGKLLDFNAVLRGAGQDAFSVISDDLQPLQAVRYVITLDADTSMPPEAARQLIGAMAHPLNRAVYDPVKKRVVRGFAILQPRVAMTMESANRSRFASIASGHPGVDPYSTAVSDVYQDLFGEGSFTGKGIYDVDVFEQATRGRFPENTLLSHDLIEGTYARAGLLTDVIVYDDYPSTYLSFVRRHHRWIRGDWQVLPWLSLHVPGPDGPERNRLSLLSRWKILDNLRRSVTPIAQLLLLVAGWTVLPGSPVRWTLLGIGAICAPWVVAIAMSALRPPFDKSWRAYYVSVWRDAWVGAQQAFLAMAFLPHMAAISADAIVRTLHRLFVSRRRLLEWQSAQLVERTVAGPSSIEVMTWRAMRGVVFATLAGALAISAHVLWVQYPRGAPLGPLVAPAFAMWTLVALWITAPAIAVRLSRPAQRNRSTLDATERDLVLRYARAHWDYFDHFVTAETHWLAPDNYQYVPDPVVAMRTSPTNIGLQLLATVSAYDLDFISLGDMTERLERTMATLATLRRFRGHFFNWYDLHDLQVLKPAYISTVDSGNIAGHLIALRQACLQLAGKDASLATRLQSVARQAMRFVSDMDFTFLYDASRKVFTIGYHPDTFAADNAYYDLLASEARLASYVAIARDDVPVEHWFRLSRALTRTGRVTSLISWSGSMFEYVMPLLVMRCLPYTLLDQTYRAALARQVAYGRERRVPWGISESAYNVRDREQTYQYRAFGIADLALKRGLGRDLVVAPYASALGALVDAPRALANFRWLEAIGALGTYGFVEAIDYTRPDPGQPFAFVHAFMAHHVGMTVVALTNVLRRNVWQRRFHADPLVRSVDVLLDERVPRRLVLQETQRAKPVEARPSPGDYAPTVRELDPDDVTSPHLALLGSSPYSVMVTHRGDGYSRYAGLDITRWRADGAGMAIGQFCFLRDIAEDRVWSSARLPVGTEGHWDRVLFALDRVTFDRHDGDIETRTEIAVVPADSAEVRRVTVTNMGRESREIEITSYGEIVMAPPDADRAHPAFSNLFVETEWHDWCTALTATRRARAPDEPALWCVHVLDAGHDRVGAVSFETDRTRFIGRGRSVRRPLAVDHEGELSGSVGAVLDPIFALRTRVRVAPGRSVSVAFTTLVATSRELAFKLADRYHEPHAAQRAFDFAWTATQVELREMGISPASAEVFQQIAAQIFYHGGSLAPPVDELRRNVGSQPQLWSYGISGDLPIVLATIDDAEGLPTLRELLMAHRFWQHRGLRVDLVVVNVHPYDYLQDLRDSIVETMVSVGEAALTDQPGGVFVRRRDLFSEPDYLMLSATARVHVACDGRSLSRLLTRADIEAARRAVEPPGTAPSRALDRATPASVATVERVGALAALASVFLPRAPARSARSESRTTSNRPPLAASSVLQFDNGIGGLNGQGDYEMTIDEAHTTPAPWINVIANPQGGFFVSERGAGCAWADNAQFYRLTPWHNDPVADTAGDAVYLQDQDTGALWSASPAPVRSDGAYRVIHGAGSTTFLHERDGIHTDMRLGMPQDAAVRVTELTIRNASSRHRRIALTAYVEWVLGAQRESTRFQVRTRFAREDGAILAQNHFDPAFRHWTAFLAVSEPVTSFTADRLAFLGADGTLAYPAALRQSNLDGVTGVGLDPCGALQMQLDLMPGESRDIVVLLGAAGTEAEARRTIQRLRRREDAAGAVTAAVEAWRTRLAVIGVRTPDAAFDALLNKWTLYQALSCRMWARTALYQSSGAFGFRDQLQDAMAVVYSEPDVARAHILRAAARQFVEGDVQHWWHPHNGRGVRTRFSDDLVWLPFVVDHYVRVTGDTSVLEERVPFLTMRALDAGQQEIYDLPAVAEEQGTVYEHCRRALHRACTSGSHGLPLMGSGDWNDGMNRVGEQGRGESVWLAWFLITTLRAFAVHAEQRGDRAEAETMRRDADGYAAAAETHGWDGQWYRRAFYDDGEPLGSITSDECRIDSIAQSWSVISGAGSAARQELAMQALDRQLVRGDARVIMLLTPPFDHGVHDPGYIKGYVPGVRENGAQYTHAAAWAVQAVAMRGDGNRAHELFRMLNPLTRTATREDMERYRVEPYVVAADIYTAPQHLGRGGWTWYTGSASWMYRVGLEYLLGFVKRGDTLRIEPCVPDSWPQFEITYRFGRTEYHIDVRSPALIRARGARVTIDGVECVPPVIALADDGRSRRVIVQPAPEPALRDP